MCIPVATLTIEGRWSDDTQVGALTIVGRWSDDRVATLTIAKGRWSDDSRRSASREGGRLCSTVGYMPGKPLKRSLL